MSRTTRRHSPRGFYQLSWAMRDHDADAIHPPQIDPKSKEGKKRIALYHADHTVRFKEPGPAWYRYITVERPQRREAKRQMRRFLRDPEFVVILNAKDPLDYWT